MKLKCIDFVSPNDEKLTTIFVLDDDDNEIKRYTFYNEKREIEIEPELVTTLNELPDLLKMVYNSGLKGEKVEFTKESITVC